MVEASNNISILVFVITTNGKVLTTQIHIVHKSQLSFVIDDI
jgi:hypothetical protein